MCRLSGNLGASISWEPRGPIQPWIGIPFLNISLSKFIIKFFFLAGRAHLVHWSDCGLAEREIFFDSLLQWPGLALRSTQRPVGTGRWVAAIKDLGACSWPLTLIHYRANEWSHMATPPTRRLGLHSNNFVYFCPSAFYWNNLSRVYVI